MPEEIKLSKEFVENELLSAPSGYTLVYLAALTIGESVERIAETLKITENKAKKALNYWKALGYLQQSEGEISKQSMESDFKSIQVSLDECGEPESQRKDSAVQQNEENNTAEPPKKRVFIAYERPQYTPEELEGYIKNDERIQSVFDYVQGMLGRSLSHQDKNMIYNFHHWLELPYDVIMLLFSYCVENGHKGIRYIEKVAIGWVDEGITTPEKVDEYIEVKKENYTEIMKAFGLKYRLPTRIEKDFMKKWKTEYHLPIDIIKEACGRTAIQANKPSFQYADKILQRWAEAGVKTMEDIAVLDREFANQKTKNSTKKNEEKRSKNRFINYPQHEYDFDEIERKEQALREKW